MDSGGYAGVCGYAVAGLGLALPVNPDVVEVGYVAIGQEIDGSVQVQAFDGELQLVAGPVLHLRTVYMVDEGQFIDLCDRAFRNGHIAATLR